MSRIDMYDEDTDSYPGGYVFAWDGDRLVSRSIVYYEPYTELMTSRILYDTDGEALGFHLISNMDGMKGVGGIYLYRKNLQGDVTHIMKSDGSIVGTYEYDAWGKITNLSSLTTIAGVNPFRYRGYYYDNESGLYYLNSRYYNPEWGRFINADGIIGETGNIHSYNLYAYCFDNPVLLTDSDGYCPYNGTAADFHRMEQGLPSLDCICSSNNLLVFNKINPNDYDDDSLYENNSQLRGRDAKRREKKQISDAFGNDRSQREQKSRDLHDSKKGKRNDNNVPFGKLKNGDVWDIAVLTGCGIAVVWIIVNDSTGIGVADDVLLSAFIPIIKEVLV